MPTVRLAASLFVCVVPFAIAPAALTAQSRAATTPAARAGTASSARQSLADVLPASTYASVSFAGTGACTAAAEEHGVAQLVRAFVQNLPKATVDQQIGQGIEMAAQQVREGLGQVGMSPTTLRAVLRRPMALGLGRLTVRGFGPSVALVIDEGDAHAEVDQLVTTLLQMAPGLDDDFAATKQTVDGVETRALQIKEGPAILFAQQQGLLVVTNSEGYLREILATAAGKQPALAKESMLGAQRAALNGSELLGMFFNTARLTAMVEPHLPYEAVEFGDALGLRSLQGVYAGLGRTADGTSETFDLALTGARTGLLKAAFADGGADATAAGMCSKDTVAFATMHLHLPAVLQAFHRFADVLPPSVSGEMQHDLQRDVARELRHLGVTPEQLHELLGALGGSMSLALNVNPTFIPEPLLFVPVKDASVVLPWIEKLSSAIAQEHGLQWKTRKVGEHDVRYCELPLGQIALSPAFTIANGYLILSSQTKNVLAALKQIDKPDASLAAAEDFAAAAQGHKGAAGFVHLRLFRAAQLGWGPLQTFVLPQLDAHKDQVGFGSDAIPEVEQVAKALGTTTWSLTVDDAGVRIRSQGSLGFGGLLVGGGWLVDDVLQRAGGKVY